MPPTVRASLAALLVTLLAPLTALAQSGPELLLKPWDKKQFIEMRNDALFLGNGEFEDDEFGGADFKLTTYESEGRIRILPGNIASPRIGYDVTYLDIDTDLPAFPDHLTEQAISAGLLLAQFESGWIMGVTLGIGYAGEGAYGNSDAIYYKGTLVFGREIDENNALGIVIDYDANRVVFPDVPLPGFAWAGRLPKRNLRLTLGFPVNSVIWDINKQTRAEFTYTFTDSFDARVTHDISPHWSLFGRVETRYNGFHLPELEETNDRLFFEQRRVEGGVVWTPAKFVSLSAAGGLAFGSEFSVGWDMRDIDNVLEVSNELYFRLGAELRF